MYEGNRISGMVSGADARLGAVGGGYANDCAIQQKANEAEIAHFIGQIQQRTAALEQALVMLGSRLHPITRQEPVAACQGAALGTRTAVTEVGGALSAINNQLRDLCDWVGCQLSTLEI